MNILSSSPIFPGLSTHIQPYQRRCCSEEDILSVELLKRSVDGRRRPPLWLANYRVRVSSEALALEIISKTYGVRLFTERDAKRYQQNETLP